MINAFLQNRIKLNAPNIIADAKNSQNKSQSNKNISLIVIKNHTCFSKLTNIIINIKYILVFDTHNLVDHCLIQTLFHSFVILK